MSYRINYFPRKCNTLNPINPPGGGGSALLHSGESEAEFVKIIRNFCESSLCISYNLYILRLKIFYVL